MLQVTRPVYSSALQTAINNIGDLKEEIHQHATVGLEQEFDMKAWEEELHNVNLQKYVDHSENPTE